MRRRALLFGLPGALWAAAGRSLAAPPAAPVTALAFSPDGRLLLSSGYRELLVRSVPDLAVVRRIPCALAQIHGLAFHPAGALLAAAGGTPGTSGAAHLLSWPAGKPLAVLGAYGDLATGLAFSPDGRRLAVPSSARVADAWDVEQWSGTQRVPGVQGSGAERPNGLGLGLGLGTERRMPNAQRRVPSGWPNAQRPTPPLLSLTGHAGPVLAVVYTADGKLLVTASADRSLRVWDAQTGALLRTLTNHTDIVHCLAARTWSTASPNPYPYCASGGDDRTARVWQPGIGRMVRIVRGHSGPVLAVLYSRGGSHLFSAGAEGVVRVIDADSDEVVRTWKASEEWIYRLALSPDGRLLAAGDAKGRVLLWKWKEA